jgi:hypothetical protein
MSEHSNTTPPRAVEVLHRRKRAATVDYFADPEQLQWNLDDEQWTEIENECDRDEGALDNVRVAIHEAALDCFYKRDIELSAFNLADCQAFLAQIAETTTRLNALLTGETDSPAVVATRDVLRGQLFDTTSPLLKAHLERSPEPAHEAMFGFDPFDDVTRQLGRLIKETAGFMTDNAEKAAKRRVETPAWDEMVCSITHAFECAGLPIEVGGERETFFVSLMRALTRRFPEKYRQHHLGRNGQESAVAMAKAISEARKSR